MLRITCRYGFSRVSEQLKLLNLKIPTSQQQIKARYRLLAKKYHPDSLKQKATKQTEEHFVEITTAYNSLKQLDQKQLTEQAVEYDRNLTSEQKEKVKTKEEELRQETYDYFRKKQFYAQKKKDPAQEKPLYKTIPELFIGTAFVLAMFGEWIYKSTIKTNKEVSEVTREQQTMAYDNVFKGFNAHKRFPMERQKENQLITPKQQSQLNL